MKPGTPAPGPTLPAISPRNDAATAQEDAIATGNVLINDGAGTGDILTVTAWSGGPIGTPSTVAGLQNATITLHSNGAYAIDAAAADALAAGESASQTFTYSVLRTNPNGTSTHSVSFVVTITGTNDAPVIATSSSTAQVTEQGSNVDAGSISASGAISFDDTDVTDLHTLSVVPVGTTLGSLASLAITDTATGAGDGTISWTYAVDAALVAYLAAGQSRVEEFTVTVADDDGSPMAASVIVRVTIVGTNDGPIAVADSNGSDVVVEAGVATGDATASGNVLANDSDVDSGDSRSVTTVGAFQGTYGTLVMASDGSWTYTLDDADADTNALAAGAQASEVFTYAISDSHGATATASLNISLTGANDGPIAVADFAIMNEDTTLTLPASSILGNDSDPDGDALALVSVQGAIGGTVALDGLGNIVFLPAKDFFGTASFTYTVQEPSGDTATAQVVVSVTPVAAPAIATDDSGFTTSGSASVTFAPSTLLVNDTGNALALSAVSGAFGGGVTMNATGAIVFTPILGYEGSASFTYTVVDRDGGTDAAVVTLAVTAAEGTSYGTAGDDAASAFSRTGGPDILNGLAGNDVISAIGGNDVIVGGLGADWVDGGAGSDTYLYRSGNGSDKIDESSGSTVDVDVLRFIDLNVADVTVSRRIGGDDLLITINATGDVIEVDEHFWPLAPNWGVERIEFADGTTWNLAKIASEAWYRGTAGVDVITGSNYSDTIIGGAGADLLNGAANSDTYLYRSGDGSDKIDESNGSTADVDVLRFLDLNFADVTFSHRIGGDDLLIMIKATGDVIEVDEQFWSMASNWGVEWIEFADGTAWSLAKITSEAWYRGTSGVDVITGSNYSDTIIGGAGADLLNGAANSDTYVYRSGDGSDKIDESNGSTTDVDVLRFLDLNVADVTVSHRIGGDDLLITINSTGDVIEVDEQFWSTASNWGVERIEFADGTSWDLAKIASEAWYRGTSAGETIVGSSFNDKIDGAAGNDTLSGGVGNDLLVGGAGNDLLTGGAGSDFYLFESAAFGLDRLLDFGDGATNEDVVAFSSSVFANFAAVQSASAQVGGNVVITYDASNSITINNVLLSSLDANDFNFV